jgi:hypothetical protein
MSQKATVPSATASGFQVAARGMRISTTVNG